MSRDRGPGFVPFPRYGVIRTNDLVDPGVDIARVRAVLTAHAVPVGDRDDPLGREVRAVLADTAAGTVVTLERRSGPWRPRIMILRRLTRMWDTIAAELDDDAPGSTKTAETRTNRRAGGS